MGGREREKKSSLQFHNCMNFKYIVAGAPSARAAGSTASVLILELRGDLTVESLFTSAHTCRPDGTHARTHAHTFAVCDFPSALTLESAFKSLKRTRHKRTICGRTYTRVSFRRRKQAAGEPSEDVQMGSGVRLDYLGKVRIHRLSLRA